MEHLSIFHKVIHVSKKKKKIHQNKVFLQRTATAHNKCIEFNMTLFTCQKSKQIA